MPEAPYLKRELLTVTEVFLKMIYIVFFIEYLPFCLVVGRKTGNVYWDKNQRKKR